MFEIPVGDLLASYSGDSKELEFSGEIPPDFYDEFQFVKPLEMKLKIIGLDDGIDVIFQQMKTGVKYGDMIKFIELHDVERQFKKHFDPLNPDDIKYINMKGTTIDLKDVIKEEILIQCID